jgi:predicted nucleotide-binding protein
VTGVLDLFKQITNAVLDLQNATLQSYPRPLKALARLLRHPDLATANAALTQDLNLDAFLAESERSQRGMMGSAELAWPDSTEKVLGLSLLLIEKFAENPDYMAQLGHVYFYTGSKILPGVQAATSQIIIPFLRDYKTYVLNGANSPIKLVLPLSNRVFIVHGQDTGARDAVARFLDSVGFQSVILHEQANRGLTVIEKVEANSDVGFAVVLLTPDDMGNLKDGIPVPRPRQNVVLELGYFIGKLGRNKVCALKRGDMEIPSELAGMVWEAMDDKGGWKQALARELQAAGHVVDWNKVMS